jgi:hypothetical protein
VIGADLSEVADQLLDRHERVQRRGRFLAQRV